MLQVGAHPEIFKVGCLNFSKSHQHSIVINLVIVKQGFAVIVAFCYIRLFKNLATKISKIVGCEDCVQKKSFCYWGLGAKPQAAEQFLQLFRKYSHVKAIWMTF